MVRHLALVLYDRSLTWLDEADRPRMRLVRIGGAAHAFDCQDGPAFVLFAVGADAADVELPDGTRRLTRQPTASGARYSDGTVVVWNKGRDALLERGGRTYQCTGNRARSIR